MRGERSNPGGSCPPAAGFTLIELLVVMAVISALLAIVLPALHEVRTAADRARCASQLRQIAVAWHAYLGDNNQQFYQTFYAHQRFGGWAGMSGEVVVRPLNKYVGLPTEPNTPDGAELFRCPADKGDADYGPSAYLYFGNSYQTNLILIGPDWLSTYTGPEPMRTLHQAINEHLVNLKADAVCDPSRLLLVGDHNWRTQWWPLLSEPGQAWHGPECRYNMAFFDGHVTLTEIHKGVYIDSDYRIQPFRELDSLTHEMQSQIVREVCGGQ